MGLSVCVYDEEHGWDRCRGVRSDVSTDGHCHTLGVLGTDVRRGIESLSVSNKTLVLVLHRI